MKLARTTFFVITRPSPCWPTFSSAASAQLEPYNQQRRPSRPPRRPSTTRTSTLLKAIQWPSRDI